MVLKIKVQLIELRQLLITKMRGCEIGRVTDEGALGESEGHIERWI